MGDSVQKTNSIKWGIIKVNVLAYIIIVWYLEHPTSQMPNSSPTWCLKLIVSAFGNDFYKKKKSLTNAYTKARKTWQTKGYPSPLPERMKKIKENFKTTLHSDITLINYTLKNTWSSILAWSMYIHGNSRMNSHLLTWGCEVPMGKGMDHEEFLTQDSSWRLTHAK